ncbi:MAG: LacI family transcriptional regulator [Tolumonas sp.]|nr:MAG: LacI family transcriptional regulator [Tolumonas sp.]
MKIKKNLLTALFFLQFLFFSDSSYTKNMNIVFIPKSSDQVFWDIMRSGVNDGLREFDTIDLTWRGPSYNDDTDAQIKILKAYTHPGVDAIIIAPTDKQQLVEPVKKAAAQGIKIIIVDSAFNGSVQQNYISTDNYLSGQLAAKRMAATLNNAGNVVIFRIVKDSASTESRAQGFIDHLQKNSPDIKIIGDIYAGGSRGKVLYNASDYLTKISSTHHIDGIFAVNESATDGVLRASRNMGIAGKVKLVGFDYTDYLVQGLENKDVDSLIIQDPRRMGYLSIKAAVEAIKNTPIKEKIIFTETKLVTKDNYKTPEIITLMHVN